MNRGSAGKISVLIWISICTALGCAAQSLGATSGSHYPYGGEGLMAASVPPPGFYYLQYDSYYQSTKLTNNDGDKMNVGFDLDVWASVQRLAYVSNYTILGGSYFGNIIIPLTDQSLSIDALGVSDSHGLTVGDILFEPCGLAWHGNRYDAAAALGVFAPTGKYEIDQPASPGLGYWSIMFSLGATYYFDEPKTWSMSALTRTLVNTEQDDTNITPGSEFVVEYGIGKQFALTGNLLMQAGLAGSAYWQFTDDSDDSAATVADDHKRVFAMGPELNFHWLKQGFFLKLRFEQDFAARNTAEGNQVMLTLVKGF